ncbi:2-octaprenyl-6-methoxyphenyl hydroxylase [Glaciecola sp. XM2]|uniref:2-octaprenyl-6-methoxyphenyl hydroxylase n=1 Tax=Glaciecola sp. XM2 TaxID=1914931 RepID=UPI001BDE0217|nr:2-octaprenyl-6-methoxyphenyl hydroxylase [Glaciecola sp. XM2]MBT1450549.1 2-octaprenyl-6-methoxyphenyl hydroxylase [Glaciecola sp. XM2]
MTEHVDVVIAGGGVVGCATALALVNKTDLSIAIIESHPPEKSNTHPSFDARVIALAKSSVDTLKSWNFDTEQVDGGDIKRIHVSDRKHIGQAVLDADQVGVCALGKVVHLEQLGISMYKDVQQSRAQYYSPDSIVSLTKHQDYIDIDTQSRQIRCKLLIIAEGGVSSTRELAGIAADEQDYDQSAIVTNVTTQLPHNNCAYERFTKHGPIAFLPMHTDAKDKAKQGRLMSVVWTTHVSQKMRIQALDDEAFLGELQSLFGSRLGKLQACTPRYQYPLTLRTANPYVSHRSVCVGNAAQSLHPIAGQGFNLGMRDVQELAEQLKDAEDIGSFETLNAYKTARSTDKSRVIGATNLLVSTFSNHFEPLVIGRNKALVGLNLCSGLKNKFARYAMGQR